MARYLLDTDTLIDFSKGREPVASRIKQWIKDDDILGICPINIAEFYAGLPHSARKDWDEFFETLTYWQVNPEIARMAGIFRQEFQKQGTTITTTDALVAAVALEQDATVVTSNISDYPMPNLRLLSPWGKD
jgi:predicted nucleic acid-binding protein